MRSRAGGGVTALPAMRTCCRLLVRGDVAFLEPHTCGLETELHQAALLVPGFRPDGDDVGDRLAHPIAFCCDRNATNAV